MINEIRLQQQQRQIKAIGPRTQPTIATYQSRDSLTGNRLLQSPDGSIVRVAWIANSNPQSIPPLVVPSQQIGQPGYASQPPSR